MKISRISQALGSISDEFSREAIEEIEKESILNNVSESTLKEPFQCIYNEPQLTDDISIAVNVEKVRLAVNGGELSAVSDDENPNVKIFTIKFDTSKADAFSFVINEDGTYKTFAGNDISEEEILSECPDGVFGSMWLYKNGDEQCSLFDGIWAFNGSHNIEGTLHTYEYWFSLDSEALRSFEEFTPEGYGGGFRIKDNGNGTFSAYMDIQ